MRTFDNSHVSLLASPKPSDVKVDSIDASQVYKYNTRRPFNYTCVFSKNVAGMGCDGQNDWSCDFKFEAAFSRAGFTTEKQGAFHNSMISSYSKGCANDYVPDFHIVTETADRPRLQCGLCSRLSEIESTGHWDGPKGGGNDKLFRGSIDGWFFNHKAQFLFWEAYMDSNACSFMNETEFIPECDTSFYASNATDFLSDIEQRGHHIVSLTDGYAFDVNKGLYCRVTHAHMLKHQLKSTYMKDYAALTARFLGYTEDQWLNRYRHYGGGEGRSKMCGRDDTETDVGDAELWESLTAGPQPGDSNSEYLKPVDKKIRKNTLKNCPHGAREDNMPVQLTEEDKVFESLDYCNLCKVKNANWKKWGNENAGGNRFVVSCTA